MKVEIMYWEDQEGTLNDVSMDLEEFIKLVQAGIHGDRTFFNELKEEVLEQVKLYQDAKLEEV